MNKIHPSQRDFRLTGEGARGLARLLLAAALACLGVSALSFFLLDEAAALQFKFSYLVSFAFLLSISLGALFFVLIQHVSGARASIAIRRLCETLMTNLYFMPILFLPILAWLPDLYSWVHPEAIASEHVRHAVMQKTGYLNVPFFIFRAILYFAIWLGLAWLLHHWSLQQDETGDPALTLKLRRTSAPGLLLFAFSVTFASFDWLMSLEPGWFSTIYGVYFFAASACAFFSVMILVIIAVIASKAVGDSINTEHLHDMGKWLFGFIVFWAYIAFSQLLLIWMANLPEETVWFAERWNHRGWRIFSWTLIFGHFALPFLFLLPRFIKRVKLTAGFAAIWMLAMHYLDLYYLVMPTLNATHVPLHITDPFLTGGLFLAFMALFIWRLLPNPIIPARDPHLRDSLAFENL